MQPVSQSVNSNRAVNTKTLKYKNGNKKYQIKHSQLKYHVFCIRKCKKCCLCSRSRSLLMMPKITSDYYHSVIALDTVTVLRQKTTQAAPLCGAPGWGWLFSDLCRRRAVGREGGRGRGRVAGRAG